jgi:hypothetical protein
MMAFPLFSLMSRNEYGSGGFACCSGRFVLPDGGRAKEADTVAAHRSACGEAPGPLAPDDVQSDRICPIMVCIEGECGNIEMNRTNLQTHYDPQLCFKFNIRKQKIKLERDKKC